MDGVHPYTGTSLFHSKRVLYYTSTQWIPYEYNVDTRENNRIQIGQKVRRFSSLMGIDCRVRIVFQDDNKYTYILNWNNEVIPLYENKEEDLTSLFVSTTHLRDLLKCVLKYDSYFVKEEKQIKFTQPVKLDWCYSIVRVYKDVFMLYDMNMRKWVLSRIIIL